MRCIIAGIILILASGSAFAQLASPTGGSASPSGGEYPGSTGLSWQMTFDVIRSKVNDLMLRNNQLSSEYKALDTSRSRVVQESNGLNKKNEEMNQLLKTRHGRTDQEIHIEELEAQSQSKQTKLAALQAKAFDLKDQAANQQKVVGLKKIKIQDLELHQNMPQNAVASSGDAQLDDLRKTLEEEKQKEVLLEDELSSTVKKIADPQMNLLRQKLDFLIQEKKELLNGFRSVAVQSSSEGVDHKVYFSSLEQKNELEKRIRQFENKINSLKGMRSLTMPWLSVKKKMVHDIVQMDARNVKLREQINNLREDVDLLRQQIASQEQKLGGYNGQGKRARK